MECDDRNDSSDDFRENVEKLLKEDPELRKLVHQALLARHRYESRLERPKDDEADTD